MANRMKIELTEDERKIILEACEMTQLIKVFNCHEIYPGRLTLEINILEICIKKLSLKNEKRAD
jgi:hypothetical protein